MNWDGHSDSARESSLNSCVSSTRLESSNRGAGELLLSEAASGLSAHRDVGSSLDALIRSMSLGNRSGADDILTSQAASGPTASYEIEEESPILESPFLKSVAILSGSIEERDFSPTSTPEESSKSGGGESSVSEVCQVFSPGFKENKLCDSDDKLTPVEQNMTPERGYVVADLSSDGGLQYRRDPSAEAEYSGENFLHDKERETMFLPKKYLEDQVDLTADIRAQLVDQMVQVQQKLCLSDEALFLAVKIVDRFLSIELCSKASLRLLGAAAISIASKFDAKDAPSVGEVLAACDDQSDSRNPLVSMEAHVFQVLNYKISMPLSCNFLNHYARGAKILLKTLVLARYVLESSLLDYNLVGQRESKMAAAALLQALRMKGLSWNAALQHHSGYDEEELRELQIRMNGFLLDSQKGSVKAISEKYSEKRYFSVAMIPLLTDEII